jgi:hypothetical protein
MKNLTVLFIILLSVSCFAQRWVDTDGNQVLPKVDAVTGAVLTIDNFTSKINDGKAFMYTNYDTIAAGDSMAFHVYADNTFNCHMTIEFEATLLTLFKVYEDCTIDTSDTLITWNINRTVATDAETYIGTVLHGKITAVGDSIIIQSFGGTAAKTEPQRYDYIVKPKSHNIIQFISGANDNVINVKLTWYELTDIH